MHLPVHVPDQDTQERDAQVEDQEAGDKTVFDMADRQQPKQPIDGKRFFPGNQENDAHYNFVELYLHQQLQEFLQRDPGGAHEPSRNEYETVDAGLPPHP